MHNSSQPVIALLAAFAIVATSSSARAHVSVAGPGFANQNQILTFSVGHGCEGADTHTVEVTIPAEVTSLRPLPGSFGEATLTRTGTAGPITKVTWSKTDARNGDDHYYQFSIRIRVPDKPFTTIYFPSTQRCRTAAGEEKIAEWNALPGQQGEPAASLMILPARKPGWNKYTVPASLADLAIFDDAEIVWAGSAAYSSNDATKALIAAEPGVTTLTEISAGAEIWVKY